MTRFLPERLRPLYTFTGRSGRKAFWLAQIGMLGACPIVALPMVLIGLGLQRLGLSDPVILLMLAPCILLAVALVFYAGFCAVVRRLRDRGRSVNFIWVLFGPAILASVTGLGLGTSAIDLAVLAAQAAAAIWYFVELGFLPGIAAASSDPAHAGESVPADADGAVAAAPAPQPPMPSLAKAKAARPKPAARVVRAGPPRVSAAGAGGFGRRQVA